MFVNALETTPTEIHWKPKKCVTTTVSAVQFTWIYKFRSQDLPAGKISFKVVLFEASCKGGEPSEPGAK